MPAKKESGEKKSTPRKKKTAARATVETTETSVVHPESVASDENGDMTGNATEDPLPSQPHGDTDSGADALSTVSDDAACTKDTVLVQEKEKTDETINTNADTTATDAPVIDKTPRYDITITSERPGYKPPKAALAAMVSQIAYRQFAIPVEEAIAETWTEIYFQPGVAAHEIFLEKAYTSSLEVFKEICLKCADKPFTCDYSKTPLRPLYWAIEIRGSRYKDILGSFRKIFQEAFNLRIETAIRDFAGLPEHKTVPVEEVPPEKKKHEKGRGLVGTSVEEY